MRHGKHKNKMNVSPSHRKLLVRNLMCELVKHGKIKTTLPKCKAIRPVVEKLVTISKIDTVANRRLAYSKLNNRNAVTELFSNIGPRHVERKGGYTRIVKVPDLRVGDGAKMAYIAFL